MTLNTTTGFAGLTALNTTGVAGATVTAAATTAISVTDTALAAGAIAVNGGSTVAVTSAGNTTGTITVGASAAAAGAVTVNSAGVYASNTDPTTGAIAVTGGTTVAVTSLSGITAAQITAQQTAGALNGTITQSSITVTGNASTTAVTATQSAAVVLVETAALGKIGVVNGAVTIADANAASVTAAGTLATVSLNNYGNATINSGALTTVNLSGTGGTVGITTGALTTPLVRTLALNLNGLSYKNAGTNNAITVDADITTLNIGNSTAASTVNNITASGATTVNVSGDALLTMTADTFAAATAINVTNTAGASFGTAVAAATTFTGGAGADTITLTADFTKANTMGAGNDTVTYAAQATGGSVVAGDGIDTIIMTTAQADAADANATFNTRFTGFETLQLSDAHTTTIDLDGLNSATKVTLAAGSNAGTINNLASGGTVQMNTTDNVTGLTIGVKSALTNASDVLNLSISNSTDVYAAGIIVAANVETINIAAADSVAAGSDAFTNTMTLQATSAKTVTVTGNNGLTLVNTGNVAITSFDASGVVANSTVATTSAVATTDTDANLGVTFASATTTAGATVTIKGGAGNDTLRGNTLVDLISGGAGIDRIYSDNAGAKSVSLATVASDGAAKLAAGDVFTITVNGITSSFTATTDGVAGDAAADVLHVSTGLAAAINDNTLLAGLVVATKALGVVTVTALHDGVVTTVLTEASADAGVTVAVAEGGAGASTLGVAGTTAIDVIDGGAGADLLVGGGGADTITTGAGADTVFMLKGHSNLAALATITDYTFAIGGTSNDKIILGDVATAMGSTTTVQNLSSSASLATAVGAAALTNTVNAGLSVFIFGGDTYAFVETTGATTTYVATDFLVKLSGTALTSGQTITGTGLDFA